MIVPKSRLSELQDENRLLKHNIILDLADNLENISVKICSGKEAISTDTATLMKDAAMWLKQMYEDLAFAKPCFLCKEFKAEGIGCEILDGNARHPCEWKYIKLYSEGE